MFNTFLLILYKLQVMKVFLSSSQNYDIIALGVILNSYILCECIFLSMVAVFMYHLEYVELTV